MRITSACLLVLLTSAATAHAQGGETPVSQVSEAPPDAPADPQAGVTGAPEKKPGTVTRLRTWARDVQLLERLNGTVDGWYPRIGGITRGAGLSFGPGYRTPLFGTDIFLDVSAAVSAKGYSALDARTRWFRTRNQRLELWSVLQFDDYPEEDFYGLGMQSSEVARTSYDLDSTDVAARVVLRPQRWALVTTTVGYMRPDVGRGGDSRYPSIEDLFAEIEAPGLREQPRFLHTTVAGEVDYRDTGGNTSRGGLYRVSAGLWNDVTYNRYNFYRLDAHLVQYVPLRRDGAHVISGRVGTAYVENLRGSRVPFYFLPYVGGLDTIRSFTEFRFKDRNALWVSGEYKWRPRSFLSVSVFADAGQVSHEWTAFSRSALRPGYGAGVGFHAAHQTILRVDAGTGGGEGWQVFIKIRPSF